MGPEKIPFEWAGLQLLEPMAILLNMAMAVLSGYFAWRLYGGTTYERAWGYFFLTFALGSVAGAVGHGMYGYWGIPGKMPGWFISLLAIYFLEQAQIMALPAGSAVKTWNRLSSGKLLVLALGVAWKPSFVWVIIQTATGLIPALLVFGWMYQAQYPSHKKFWQAFALMIPALVLVVFKLDPHLWMNRDDVSHLLMLGTLALCYQAVRGRSQHIPAKSRS
jgi:hypothetical protein